MIYQQKHCDTSPSPTQHTIFWLYALGDLRAQGILREKNFWHLAIFLIPLGICLTTCYKIAHLYVSHPLGDASTLLAVLSMSTFLFLTYNALCVGVLSGTNGRRELNTLSCFPVTTQDFLKWRVFLGILRAEIVTVVLFVPCCIAAATVAGFSWPLFLSALGTLLIFPLVPAAIGTWLNMRETKPRFAVWMQIIIMSLTIGIYLAGNYPVAPGMLGIFATIFSLPARGVLFLASPMAILVFLTIWLLSAVLIWREIVHSSLRSKAVMPSSGRRRLAWISLGLRFQISKNWSCMISLMTLALERVSVAICSIAAVILFLVVYMTLHLVSENQLGGLHFSLQLDALLFTLVSGGLLIPYVGLFLATTLGEAKEHRPLQNYPISILAHTGTIALVALFLTIIWTCVICLVVSVVLHTTFALWLGLFIITSAFGGGSLLLTTALERHRKLRCVLWSLTLLPYLFIKIVIADYGSVIFHLYPLFGAWLLGGSVDIVVALVVWRWLMARHYKHFVEEI